MGAQTFGPATHALLRIAAGLLFMPVINVPFRLIFAVNPSREGVLGNDLRPQEFFQFRFAVGSTF